VLVVVGSPSARAMIDGRLVAAGVAADIARDAAAAGGATQIVGRVGDDAAGDAVLLDLAAADVGHVAVLRTAGEPTPVASEPPLGDVDDEGAGPAIADDSGEPLDAKAGLGIDAADLELALRYLPDYRVIVVASGLDPAALETVVEAAGWSGAQLVVIDVAGTAGDAVPADATVLAQPPAPDAAFAAVVARYAVELDRGSEPGTAFATASAAVGWQPVEG
jgi:hypothetical protein